MKEVLIVTALTLFILGEARPGVVTQKPVEPENYVNHARVRRGSFDYRDYMDSFWENLDKCTGCNYLNIGNGYKNKNVVHMESGRKSGNHNNRLNIGNGYKNRNKVLFGREWNSGNQGTVSIGNGSKNTNMVVFGAKRGSGNEDPFTGSFWED